MTVRGPHPGDERPGPDADDAQVPDVSRRDIGPTPPLESEAQPVETPDDEEFDLDELPPQFPLPGHGPAQSDDDPDEELAALERQVPETATEAEPMAQPAVPEPLTDSVILPGMEEPTEALTPTTGIVDGEEVEIQSQEPEADTDYTPSVVEQEIEEWAAEPVQVGEDEYQPQPVQVPDPVEDWAVPPAVTDEDYQPAVADVDQEPWQPAGEQVQPDQAMDSIGPEPVQQDQPEPTNPLVEPTNQDVPQTPPAAGVDDPGAMDAVAHDGPGLDLDQKALDQLTVHQKLDAILALLADLPETIRQMLRLG